MKIIVFALLLVCISTAYIFAKDISKLTHCQLQMLTYANALNSDKLKKEVNNPNLTCSQREYLVNEERIRQGLEPIKFTIPANPVVIGR